MNSQTLYELILGLITGAVIVAVSTFIADPRFSLLKTIILFVGYAVIGIAVINFVFALLGFPQIVKIG